MPPRQSAALRLILLALMLLGVAVIAWSLFQPLVRFPVVGSLGFSESNLGGRTAAWGIAAALALASGLLLLPAALARVGLLVGGLSIGYLGATLMAIYRSGTDKALELADSGGDSGIRTLLAA